MNRRKALQAMGVLSLLPLVGGSPANSVRIRVIRCEPPIELVPSRRRVRFPKPCPADEDFDPNANPPGPCVAFVCRATRPRGGPVKCRIRTSRHFNQVCPKMNPSTECLRTALRLAAGELSTHEPHTGKHPQEVYDELLTAAREFQEPPHV